MSLSYKWIVIPGRRGGGGGGGGGCLVFHIVLHSEIIGHESQEPAFLSNLLYLVAIRSSTPLWTSHSLLVLNWRC